MKTEGTNLLLLAISAKLKLNNVMGRFLFLEKFCVSTGQHDIFSDVLPPIPTQLIESYRQISI